MTAASPLQTLEKLRAAGAAQVDAVGWHRIETLALRTRQQSGPAQALLLLKLQETLAQFEVRMTTASAPPAGSAPGPAAPSPLAALLQDMAVSQDPSGAGQALGRLTPSPRILQFRKRLNQLRVHTQLKQAMAQAPQNAGPINSHMLVLRSLRLMREVSPDYLQRFMGYVDTLRVLDGASLAQATPRAAARAELSNK